MSDLFFADLVRESSTSVGTGAFVLSGAMPGHRRFADAVPPDAQFHYAIAGITDEREWEVGLGALDAFGQLVRAPLSSSNDGALVDFSEGLKTVVLTVAANWFAVQAASGGVGADIGIGDVGGLQAALDGKQAAGSYAVAGHDHAGVYAASGHNHDAAYAALGHDHAGLYAALGHSHPEYAGGLVADGNGRYGMGTAAARSRLDVRGAISGGFGGTDLNTGTSVDWGGADQIRAGFGQYILRGTSLGGPGGSSYFHAMNLESGSAKDGSGLTTQIAIPYANGDVPFFFRRKPSGQPWQSWQQILSQDGTGAFVPVIDNASALGSAALRFATLYAGSSPIIGSDAAIKTDVADIPDAVLDAWGDIGWRQYRFVDAVAAKGDAARLHAGLIAQQVDAAFAARGLDARAYGLLCRDEWDARLEPELDADGEPTGATIETAPAGSLWQIRYDEAQAMEAAWQRREIARLEARIAALETAA